MTILPISGLQYAVLSSDGALNRYPIVGADADGNFTLAHVSAPHLIPAGDVFNINVIGTATVSSTLPRDQAVSACKRNGVQAHKFNDNSNVKENHNA